MTVLPLASLATEALLGCEAPPVWGFPFHGSVHNGSKEGFVEAESEHPVFIPVLQGHFCTLSQGEGGELLCGVPSPGHLVVLQRQGWEPQALKLLMRD